jgi:hypothetical protein
MDHPRRPIVARRIVDPAGRAVFVDARSEARHLAPSDGRVRRVLAFGREHDPARLAGVRDRDRVDELVALGAFEDATSVDERGSPRAATVVVFLSASQDAPMIVRPQRR